MLPGLPGWSTDNHRANGPLRGAGLVLNWLAGHPGDGRQQRWAAPGADDRTRIDKAAAGDPPSARTARGEIVSGLSFLLLARPVLPSYGFLGDCHSRTLIGRVRKTLCPNRFSDAERTAAELGMNGRQTSSALVVSTKTLLHIGKDLDQLTADDFFQARARPESRRWPPRRSGPHLSTVWSGWLAAGLTCRRHA